MAKKMALVGTIVFLLEAHHVFAFTLETNHREGLKLRKRRFNHVTAIYSYLDQLAPEAPKGSAPVSYMAKITTSPKLSAITSYLDTVSGAAPEPVAAPAYSPPAAPEAPAYSAPSADASSATPEKLEYTNSFSNTNADTKQTHTHTHHHVHSYKYTYDSPQPVHLAAGPEPVAASPSGTPVSSFADSNESSGVVTGSYIDSFGSKSPISASPVFPASSGPAIAAAAATYLSALGTNVMASGGGTAMTNPHLATIPVTAPACTGYSTLGNDHLNIMPVTAPSCQGSSTLGVSHLDYVSGATLVFGDYSAAPAASAAPPAAPAPPAYSAPAASTPPATGGYLSALDTNVMSSGGDSSLNSAYLAAIPATTNQPQGASTLQSSYLSSVSGNSASYIEGSVDHQLEAAKPQLSSFVEQAEGSTSIIETPTIEAELVPTSNNHAHDTFISGLKVVTNDMGKSMREAVDVLAKSGDEIAGSIKRSSVTLAASNIIGNDELDNNEIESRLALLKRTVDEMQ